MINKMDYGLRDEYIELCQLLKVTGLCDSGGQAKYVIMHEEVMVDGVVETRKKNKIRVGQTVLYRGTAIHVIAT